MGRPEAPPRQRGVGRHDPVDPRLRGQSRDLVERARLQVGGDLEEHRRRSRQRGPRLHHAAEKRAQGGGALEVAQRLRVGRGDVDGDEVGMASGHGQHPREIGAAVCAVLVGAEVQPDRDAARPRGQPRADRVHAVIVEAEPVDDRPVLRKPEQARLRVAGLGPGGGGADLEEAEARPHQGGQRDGVLVVARRQSHRIGQRHPGERDPQPLIRGRTGHRHEPGPEKGERGAVRALGVQPVQRPEREALGDADQAKPSGKRCAVPSQGRGCAHSTASRRSEP